VARHDIVELEIPPALQISNFPGPDQNGLVAAAAKKLSCRTAADLSQALKMKEAIYLLTMRLCLHLSMGKQSTRCPSSATSIKQPWQQAGEPLHRTRLGASTSRTACVFLCKVAAAGDEGYVGRLQMRLFRRVIGSSMAICNAWMQIAL
jgi:hypothetical protein